jgi:hypothetical protein
MGSYQDAKNVASHFLTPVCKLSRDTGYLLVYFWILSMQIFTQCQDNIFGDGEHSTFSCQCFIRLYKQSIPEGGEPNILQQAK